MEQVLPDGRPLLPPELMNVRPACTQDEGDFSTDDISKMSPENAALRQSLPARNPLAKQTQDQLVGQAVDCADIYQRLREQTARCEAAVFAQQQLETRLAQSENKLRDSIAISRRTQSDLENTWTEFQRLQAEHTRLLSITRQSVSISNCGMPSTVELLLELDHQNTQNRLFERMFAHYLDREVFQQSCQTLNYLNMWHGRIRESLGLARLDAESWRIDVEEMPGITEAGSETFVSSTVHLHDSPA